MTRTIAIVAHFDANNSIEKNFMDILQCVSEVVDEIFLVTTSDINSKDISTFNNLKLVKRPNIGYDFYSYRVGLHSALRKEDNDVERVFLINSSFILIDPQRFKNALRRMVSLNAAGNDVVGGTYSLQIEWHLQSYLLLIGRRVLWSSWFREYVSNIQPLNTKLETILRYELGLSAAVLTHRVRIAILFNPSGRALASARNQWSKVTGKRAGLKAWLKLGLSNRTAQFNPTHFLASEIATELGYVKTEMLRDNPYRLSTDFVRNLADGDRLREIEGMLRRHKHHYRTGEDNLTTLSQGSFSLPQARQVQWGQPHIQGVNIAVVLHLYYFDLLEEFCQYLSNIVPPFDLYVTTPFEGDVPGIINRCSCLAQSVSVLVAENRGRDIGPFVALYRSGILDGYAAVLKLHSKKSKYSDKGASWRDRLLHSVVGDSLAVQKTLRTMASGEVGIVGPNAYYLTHDRFWGSNLETMRRLLAAMNLLSEGEEPELGFFAGSMFWFSPNALRPLKTIAESELSFEPEDGRQDGTLAHALERLFCPIARKAGYRTTSVILNGCEIHCTQTLGNRIPVL